MSSNAMLEVLKYYLWLFPTKIIFSLSFYSCGCENVIGYYIDLDRSRGNGVRVYKTGRVFATRPRFESGFSQKFTNCACAISKLRRLKNRVQHPFNDSKLTDFVSLRWKQRTVKTDAWNSHATEARDLTVDAKFWYYSIINAAVLLLIGFLHGNRIDSYSFSLHCLRKAK